MDVIARTCHRHDVKLMGQGYVHSTWKVSVLWTDPECGMSSFSAGCAMRCQFCHNPDTWNMKERSSVTTADELPEQVHCGIRAYWGNRRRDHGQRGRTTAADGFSHRAVSEKAKAGRGPHHAGYQRQSLYTGKAPLA